PRRRLLRRTIGMALHSSACEYERVGRAVHRWRIRSVALLLCGAMWQALGAATVVEYYDRDLDNFFITADPVEQAFVDSAAVGRWQRTGTTCRAGGPNPVCRFYGNANIAPARGRIYGPTAHFYTADAAECAGLRAQFVANAKSGKFESNDFPIPPAA